MKPTTKKIQQFESLFQLAPTKEKANTRALSQEAVAELKAIMNFLKVEGPLPDSLIEWLAQLGLMYGLPFNNLVVDEKLLSHDLGKEDVPTEDRRLRETNVMRFFYIDMEWIDSLIDGALSIGTHNSKDFKLQQAVHKAFRPHIEDAMLAHRVKLKGQSVIEDALPQKMGTLSGFIMRSPIIAQWPGIEIRAYEHESPDINDDSQMLHVLRMERLSIDTMLMIFKGVPKSVLIKEPAEGVYAGFEYIGKGKPYRLAMREVRGEGKIGKPIEDPNATRAIGKPTSLSSPQHEIYAHKSAWITNNRPQIKNAAEYEIKSGDYRNEGKRVLNITELRGNLKKKLNVLERYPGDLTPKDMGVLFVNSPRYYFFERDG